jgi:hypothetical protein
MRFFQIIYFRHPPHFSVLWGLCPVSPFVTAFAYPPGERAGKCRANPPGRGIVHLHTGSFPRSISRKERHNSVGWQG